MKQTFLLLFFIFLVLGCSPEKNSDDTANTDDTSNTDDDTNPPDEPTLRLWKEEFERIVEPLSLSNREYVYDTEGKMEKVTANIEGEIQIIFEYEYDVLGRLITKRYLNSNTETHYMYDANSNIISSTASQLDFASEYDYDGQGRLIEWRQYLENGNLHCTRQFFYDNGDLHSNSIFICSEKSQYSYVWDNKKQPHRTAFPEGFCKINLYKANNLVYLNIGEDYPYLHYDITYNEFDLPIEIKLIYNDVHRETYRFQYQEVD